ncbi:hypothetical protein GCM10027037_33680 [Mucilaginibacter koreensis]
MYYFYLKEVSGKGSDMMELILRQKEGGEIGIYVMILDVKVDDIVKELNRYPEQYSFHNLGRSRTGFTN